MDVQGPISPVTAQGISEVRARSFCLRKSLDESSFFSSYGWICLDLLLLTEILSWQSFLPDSSLINQPSFTSTPR